MTIMWCATEDVVIDSDTVISGAVEARSVHVMPGATLEFDPDADTSLTVTGNVIVGGILQVLPAGHSIQHRLTFSGVNESAFLGGGHAPVDTDVGLWVVGAGRLIIEGTTKEAWNRRGESPTWQPGDEIRVAPINAGDTATLPSGHAGSFATFVPGSPVPYAEWRGNRYYAEILNLTRNVVIEGTESGRAHIMVTSSAKHSIQYVEIRHMGPRTPGGSGSANSTKILGRYALHFHHCGDGSRGTIVRGVVAKHCGSHAFVAHSSNGIDFEECISYNTFEPAYWWDKPDEGGLHLVDSIRYRNCVAALVRNDPWNLANRLAGFHLGQGTNLWCVGCVAVGCQGNGFDWPELPVQTQGQLVPNTWIFSHCVAHNNFGAGTFSWQNDTDVHELHDLQSFRNRLIGISHGAYLNVYDYAGLVLFQNGRADKSQSAAFKNFGQSWPEAQGNAIPKRRHRIRHSTISGERSDGTLGPCVTIDLHTNHDYTNFDRSTRYFDINFVDCGGVVVRDQTRADFTGRSHFIRCTIDGRDLEPSDFEQVTPHASFSRLWVERRDGSAYQILPDGSAVPLTRRRCSNML
jgi:hypothetical protein